MISVKLEYIWMCVLETNQLQIPVEMFGGVLFRGFHNKIKYYNDNIIGFFYIDYVLEWDTMNRWLLPQGVHTNEDDQHLLLS